MVGLKSTASNIRSAWTNLYGSYSPTIRWSIKIQSFEDKGHFLQYAGGYLRRPLITPRRITWIGKGSVRFWYNDKKLHRRVEVECSVEEFVDRWAQHIPETLSANRPSWHCPSYASYVCDRRMIHTVVYASLSL
jgi:hypothetical protein